MKTKLQTIALVAAFLAIPAVFAVLMPSESVGAPGDIAVVYAPGAGNALDPANPAWTLAVTTVVDLRHINYNETACGSGTLYEKRLINVRAIHDGMNIFFRFDWNDPTMDASVGDPNLFADGVGLMIPFDLGGNTAIQMGTMNNPVNIMFWRADFQKPQNLAAGGIGSVTTSPDAASQNIAHYQKWTSGVWTVIMSRPMIAATVNQITFTRGMSSSIVFMNLDGSDFERDGHKTISAWTKLSVR